MMFYLFIFLFSLPLQAADPLKSMSQIATQAMIVDKTRMRVASENMANAQSSGYLPKDVIITTIKDRKTGSDFVEVQKIEHNGQKTKEVYDPSHPQANANGYVQMPDINPLVELVNLQETKQSMERHLRVYENATDLRHKTINLMQTR